MKFTAKETKTITAKITPCARPRFNRGNLTDALTAAARLSLHTGEPVQIISTYYGYSVVEASAEPTPGNAYYQTDGKSVTLFQRI